MTSVPREGTDVAPDVEAKARELRDLSERMKESTAAMLELGDQRTQVMLDLRAQGWNNAQIAAAAGLTRARVSVLLPGIRGQAQPVG